MNYHPVSLTCITAKIMEHIIVSNTPGAQGSKMSRAGPKGLKVVSNWKFCADSENQRLTCRTWEVFQIRRFCCHGNNSAKN